MLHLQLLLQDWPNHYLVEINCPLLRAFLFIWIVVLGGGSAILAGECVLSFRHRIGEREHKGITTTR